jgi:hypothetical protein
MSEQIQPRPSVMAFARAMELTLRKHDAKKGGQANWRKDDAFDLYDQLCKEVDELSDAFEFEGNAEIVKEAIDVANFAMMIWDTTLLLPEATDPQGKDVK